MPSQSSGPLVSVVTATFNRSAVLALTLDAALRQTIADLELIAVGDGCTDDTQDVVEGIGDPRVTWINRAVNAGDQSAPNNDGVRLARGRYLAFLNHDDLWWPDHLERGIEQLERTGAGVAVSFAAVVGADGRLEAKPLSDSGRYQRHLTHPASTWVMRREVADAVGPWRPASRLFTWPSQDWLLRADRAGCEIVESPHLTVLLVPSGLRRGSYTQHAGADDHASWHAQIVADPEALRTRVLTEVALRCAAKAAEPLSLKQGALRVGKDVVRRTALRCGVTPAQVECVARFRRRGGSLAALRRVRGLDP
jgi:glycosyltransferase involved in cell wall biosynthesis